MPTVKAELKMVASSPLLAMTTAILFREDEVVSKV
jgi:hypothetical protein